jgi:hypothetical protein
VEILENAILQTFKYYSFFNHALTAEEVRQYLSVKASKAQVHSELQKLLEKNKIYGSNGYFVLVHQKDTISKRIESQKINGRLKRIGKIIGLFILRFPYVKAVYISGSVSKDGAQAGDDIDFFIIAAAERIWISKFFLMLFKKVFLLNSNRYFCVNLIISSDALEIQKKNIYTATEAISVMPIKNNLYTRAFQIANRQWLHEYFPNHRFVKQPIEIEPNDSKNQHSHSSVLILNRLNIMIMRQFEKHAHKKYKNKKQAHILFDEKKAAIFPDSPESAILKLYHQPHEYSH